MKPQQQLIYTPEKDVSLEAREQIVARFRGVLLYLEAQYGMTRAEVHYELSKALNLSTWTVKSWATIKGRQATPVATVALLERLVGEASSIAEIGELIQEPHELPQPNN